MDDCLTRGLRKEPPPAPPQPATGRVIAATLYLVSKNEPLGYQGRGVLLFIGGPFMVELRNMVTKPVGRTYSQSSGELFENGVRVAIGYAGQGSSKNTPRDQEIVRFGPLPRGAYKIGDPYSHARLGPVVMNLEPIGNQPMFGRSAFRIHGDSTAHPGQASEGCIVLDRTTRERIAASPDRLIIVGI